MVVEAMVGEGTVAMAMVGEETVAMVMVGEVPVVVTLGIVHMGASLLWRGLTVIVTIVASMAIRLSFAMHLARFAIHPSTM
jgi:hypothetical protein